MIPPEPPRSGLRAGSFLKARARRWSRLCRSALCGRVLRTRPPGRHPIGAPIGRNRKIFRRALPLAVGDRRVSSGCRYFFLGTVVVSSGFSSFLWSRRRSILVVVVLIAGGRGGAISGEAFRSSFAGELGEHFPPRLRISRRALPLAVGDRRVSSGCRYFLFFGGASPFRFGFCHSVSAFIMLFWPSSLLCSFRSFFLGPVVVSSGFSSFLWSRRRSVSAVVVLIAGGRRRGETKKPPLADKAKEG